jgi:hypothetical protein
LRRLHLLRGLSQLLGRLLRLLGGLWRVPVLECLLGLPHRLLCRGECLLRRTHWITGTLF